MLFIAIIYGITMTRLNNELLKKNKTLDEAYEVMRKAYQQERNENKMYNKETEEQNQVLNY
jgi:ABC-type transporter lipoprotein component MlaA